jgi:hypothetical protein
VENIRPFEYRPRRIETGFAVDFACGSRTSQGVCWNIAEAGIRAEFASFVRRGEIGQITLYLSGRVFKFDGEVVYASGRHVGLVFRFQNQREREEAAEIARLCKPLKSVTQANIDELPFKENG